ncbi:MAG: hypothetical protein LBQ60_15150 [Bacteroidales bacterium]|jgi:hypothetical protein|nr:hypothetical protein [Bacteroidales bacterium]
MKTLFENRNIHLFLSGILIMMALIIASCDKDAIYDSIKDFSEKEEIYPAAFDTIYGRVGFERVEIDLRKDGRIPASKIIMGRAQKTIVTYDTDTPDPKEIVIDSVCSYVNVTNLTEPRLYRFLIYTEDQYGYRSTPQEISLVPYTSYDRDVLSEGILNPNASIASSAILLEWPTGLHTIMMEYHGLICRYTDADGKSEADTLLNSPRVYASNLPSGQEVTFDMTYRVLPILDDGRELLDTINVERPYVVQMPTPDQPFVPTELNTLRGNGINVFTLEEADKVTELVYPMNMTTFADLFFFNKVHTLDLTGKGLPGTLEVLDYGRNGVTSRVGGGAWQEFMMPVDQPAKINAATGNAPESLQTLKDAIESGQITTIRYIEKTMGTAFDTFLEPYVGTVVTKIPNSDPFFPDRVFIEPQFFANGWVQADAWDMNLSHSGNFLPRPGYTDISRWNLPNTGEDVVNGETVNLQLGQLIQNDGKNIYRCVIKQKNATFIFALPRQWRFDNQRYPYVKFKMFIGCKKEVVTNNAGANQVGWDIFRLPWIRPMNSLWGYPQNSDYTQQSWDAGKQAKMGDAEIQTSWHEYTIDMRANDGGDNSQRRNRVYAVNIGGEGSATFAYTSAKEVVVYIADFRLCKTTSD